MRYELSRRMWDILKEFLLFLRQEKQWWLVPLVLVLLLWWLVPARDAFAFAVWLAGLFGHSVVWRGQRLQLAREGRIK